MLRQAANRSSTIYTGGIRRDVATSGTRYVWYRNPIAEAERAAIRVRSIVVLEGNSDGHRLEYVRHIFDAAQQSNLSVTLLTSRPAIDSAEFVRELGSAVDRGLRPVVSLERGPSQAAFFRNWHLAHREVRRQGADLIVPGFDSYLPAALLTRSADSKHVRGLLMRPPANSGAWRHSGKRAVVERLRRRGATVLELTSPFTASAGPHALMDPSGLLEGPPDHSRNREFRRDLESWLREGTGPVVGVFGTLDERKCVVELVSAAEIHPAARIIAIGRMGSSDYAQRLSQVVSRAGSRVFHRPTPLSSADLSFAIAKTDGLALLYRNSVGSSGFLAHAIAHRKPVIGYGNETVVNAIQSGTPGVVVADLSPAILSDAFDSLAGNSSWDRISTEHDLQARCRAQWSSFTVAPSQELARDQDTGA